MKLVEKILADIGEIGECKLKRPFDIKDLGYRFSKKKITVKDSNYILCEVVDEDTLKPATFSFLLAKRTNMGLVLPFPFSKYSEIAVEEKKTVKGVKKGQSV